MAAYPAPDGSENAGLGVTRAGVIGRRPSSSPAPCSPTATNMQHCPHHTLPPGHSLSSPPSSPSFVSRPWSPLLACPPSLPLTRLACSGLFPGCICSSSSSRVAMVRFSFGITTCGWSLLCKMPKTAHTVTISSRHSMSLSASGTSARTCCHGVEYYACTRRL
jgi:hypothetical protein